MKPQQKPRRQIGWILIVVGSAVALVSCIGISGIAGFLVYRWRSASEPPAPVAVAAVAPNNEDHLPVAKQPAQPPVKAPDARQPDKGKQPENKEPVPTIKFREVKEVAPYDPVPATPQFIQLQELRGHRGPVFAAALSSDAALAVTGGADMTVRLWNVAQGKETFFFTGHKAAVRDIAISSNSKHAASASDDGTIRLWDLDQHAPGLVLTGHRGKVNCVAFSPDGSQLYSGGEDRSLRVWNTTTGRQLSEFYGHDGAVLSITLSKDGKRALTGGAEHGVLYWNLETGAELCYINAPHAVPDVAFLSDDRRAVVASDETSFFWDVEDAGRWVGPSGWANKIHTIRVLPGDRIALAGLQDGRLEGLILPMRPLKFQEILRPALLDQKVHNGTLHRIRLSTDGKTALTAGADGVAKVWRISLPILQSRIYEGHAGHVRRLAIAPDGRHFVSCGWDQTARVWDIDTGKVVARFTGSGHPNVNGAGVAGDRLVVSAGADRVVRVWELQTGKEIRHMDGHQLDVDYVAVSRDGKRAVTSCKDKTFRVWDIATGKQLHVFTGQPGGVASAVFTSDGRKILTCGDDNLRLYDAETGAQLQIMKIGFGEAILSSDDRYAISASSDNTACLWEVSTGKKIRSFVGHGGMVYGVDLSPDGKRALTASHDRTVRLWDVETGHELQRFEGHNGLVWCVRFTRDGKYALSSSEDRTIRLWPLPAKEK
jgi:WD40 repeat protein